MSKAETMIPQKGETEPQLRFEGFSGEWSKSQLNKVSKVFIGLVTTMTKNYVQRGIPLIRNSDIKANKINQDKLINLDPEFVELNKSRKLKAGDIVTVHTGDVGVSSVIPSNLDGCIGFATLNTRLMTKEINPYYLALFFNTELFLNWCKSVSTGDGRCNLNLKDFEKAKILHPILEEQTKIGELFQKLDRAIELQQQKVEQSERYKKAMLQKMFPQKGETKPQLRFEGFSGEWSGIKLKDVSESIEYGLNAKAKPFDGKNKYIRITDIDDQSNCFKKDNLTSPDIDTEKSDNFLLKEGDILFARTGASTGKTYLYKNSDGHVYFAGFLIRARIKSKYNAGFIFQNTRRHSYFKFVTIMSQRSGQPGMNASEYANWEFYIPLIEEQTKIGEFFQALDARIEAETEKLNHYESLKKAMLQRMFV